MTDPLAPLVDLPGVSAASDEARDALGRAHRHKFNLRGWPQTAAEAALRAARASAVLDGGAVQLSADGEPDPVTAGAIRVAEALEGGATALVGVWHDEHLGRPRTDPDVGRRLELLTEIVAGGSKVPAPVLAAVAHGELLSLAPFGTADGVVARAVSRLVTIASGLDPHGLGVPEVHWMRKSGEYRAAARGFASGTPDGLTAWLLLSSEGLKGGAREALQIAQSAAG
ncbi:oxidoreductase [Mycolicibacterium fortuitum]|uniref:oxidoreductase n=1 Tax=Mycolicibacterium fortuitum TaxID=1766 RepID=UPI00113076C5|nr:oxidoreductase [Mycolicibacterium fortuitum]TPW94539.1 oxidoreductase [Mycolicibacterium fortuitum]